MTTIALGVPPQAPTAFQPEGNSLQEPQPREASGSTWSPASRRAVRTSVIRPTKWQAANAHRVIAGWLAALHTARPDALVVDLSAAHRLDWTVFGILFATCRDILDIPVVVTGAGADQVQTLRGLALLANARVVPEPCRHPRGWALGPVNLGVAQILDR